MSHGCARYRAIKLEDGWAIVDDSGNAVVVAAQRQVGLTEGAAISGVTILNNFADGYETSELFLRRDKERRRKPLDGREMARGPAQPS